MSDITFISAILVVIVAFFAGLEGILDNSIPSTIGRLYLIGLVTGNLGCRCYVVVLYHK